MPVFFSERRENNTAVYKKKMKRSRDDATNSFDKNMKIYSRRLFRCFLSSTSARLTS